MDRQNQLHPSVHQHPRTTSGQNFRCYWPADFDDRDGLDEVGKCVTA
jgi:hypothetical protein